MIAATDPAAASAANSDWSLRLQLRIMRLLLLHDQRLFHGQFRTFFVESALPPIALFQQYDRYIRLLTFSDELLDDILPRVRRQLSLQTSQTRLREEAPTRGDIDWRRTIERGWSETPGLSPIQFDTHLRQRSTATPANLLVVALLLAYRQELAYAIRDDLGDEALGSQERQILTGADEQAERELAAPYAGALREQAHTADIDLLASQVGLHLRPGPNPYRDLIAWWRRFRELQIGRAEAERRLALANRRDDEKADAWLYELWIALELVHLLQQERAIVPDDTRIDRDLLQFSFIWQGRRLHFRYNRQYDDGGGNDSANLGWEYGPTSRPDYTIEREQLLEVTHNGALIWREPPVVLDAKYYLRGQDPSRTHAPIKKLLGDLALLGARESVLFFACLPDPPAGAAATRVIQRAAGRHHAGMAETPRIQLYQIMPGMPIDTLQSRLRAVLNYAADQLPDRPPVACHGTWLDADSMNVSRSSLAPQRILCPKPHIGPAVFDLIDPDTDCLKNPLVCHVIQQPITIPLVIRAGTREELAQQTGDLRRRMDDPLSDAERRDDDEHAEQMRGHIFTGVGRTIERYVKLRGNTATIEETFERWVFDIYWRGHAWSLSAESRMMLLSGEYVWQEYAQTQLDDWAAPAIQFCRALEHELKRRTYAADNLDNYKLSKAGWTLGTPLHAYEKRIPADLPAAVNARHNWSILIAHVQACNADPVAFENAMRWLVEAQVGKHRNTLAHSNAASREMAQVVRATIIGDRRRPGVLCWVAEHLRPITRESVPK